MPKKILIVEDEANIRELLRLYLEREGYTVLEAENGVEGIKKWKSDKPDMLLLDVMMPVMDGWAVCREIRAESDVPIIMLTAKGETADRVSGLEMGADDYIVKPFEIAELVARVESDEKRDRTMLDSAALEFLDADGHAITDSSITVLEGEQVEVTIPVLKLKEVPLKFEFSNVPAGYDPAELNASISPATIRIAGAADTVDGIESVNAGFINLARVQLGKAETLKIQLSEGLVNVDDVQEATVTFDTSGYGEPRAITVSDIRVVNAPSGVDVKVITESINNVTLVGEAEELAAISPSDVIAQVDASAQNITVKGSGQQQFSAQIIVTGTKTVFATGAYSVLCDITVK